MNRTITIVEVAQAANVSTMTVSRVLNNNKNVSVNTKRRVLAAAEALGYKPNLSARNLSSRRAYTVGLFYNFPNGAYMRQFLLAAMRRCQTLGLHLLVEEIAEGQDAMQHQLQRLLANNKLDGVILLPPIADDLALLDYLEQQQLYCVRISPERQLHRSHYICMDDYAAAFDMTRKLIAKGHQHIGFIKGRADVGASQLRLQGFLDALRSEGMTQHADLIVAGDFSYRCGLSAAEALLSATPRPTAIFACNDDMAAATVAVGHKLHLDMPEQLSVVGFDDTEIATIIWPALTTVKQPIEAMAAAALDCIGQHADSGQAEPPGRQVLPYSIIERDSLATAP